MSKTFRPWDVDQAWLLPASIHDFVPARHVNSLAAGPPKGQRRVDLVLDLDQSVQDHRPTLVEIDLIGVDVGALPIVRVPAVNLEGLGTRRTVGLQPALAGPDSGIGGEAKLNHLSTDVGYLD
jgi:hypothetical protein